MRRSACPLKMWLRNFRRNINNSVIDSFCIGSVEAQFHADIAINGITLQSSEGAASKDGGTLTKREEIVYLQGDVKGTER